MADTAPKPRDVPGLDTYAVPAEEVNVEHTLEVGLPLGQELAQDIGSAALYRRSNPDLIRTAEKIGTLLGMMVNAARTLRCQLQAVPERASSITDRVRERSGELREDVSEAATELRQAARTRVERARVQAVQYAQENPFQVIAAVAGAAFVLGVGLRAWRSSRD